MKLIILIIFIIFGLTIAQVPPKRPHCITTKNIYKDFPKHKIPDQGEVNWWFLNQLKIEDAIYTDSNLQCSKTILEVKEYSTRKIPESPLYDTYIQSYDTLNYHSITYNDDVTEELLNNKKISQKTASGPNSAHAKGFFIWNENGGIHVIHSFPKAPTLDTNRFVHEAGANSYSQHAMCIELSTSELNIIPKYLIYSNSDLHTIDNVRLNKEKDTPSFISLSLLEGTSKSKDVINSRKGWDFEGEFDLVQQNELNGIKTFDKMEAFLEKTILKNPFWKNKIEIGKWKHIALKIAGNDITSDDPLVYDNVHYFKAMDHLNGKYFVQTSNKNLRANYQSNPIPNISKIKYEIIWKYIKNQYTEINNWISHTMTSVKIEDDTLIKTEDNLHLVYKFQSETLIKKSFNEISTSKDHSKLFYGYNNDKDTVFCVGDLNWQGIQILRGGGAFCRTDLGYLVDFFTRRVSWFRSHDDQKNPNKYGILNSLFTVRAKFNLDWIGKIIKDEYKLDGTNLNEITPNSNENASSDYKSMLKLRVTKPANYQQLLTKSDVETEPFSVNVYPSIENRVFICPLNLPKCDYFTFKIEILKEVILPVSYIIPNFDSKGKKTDVKIDVKVPTNLANLERQSINELQNLVTCATIAKKYVDAPMNLPAPIEPITLIRNTNKNTFKSNFNFPLSTEKIGQICNGDLGTGYIYFNEDCQDLLYICLYRDQLGVNVALSTDEVIALLKTEFGDISKVCLESNLQTNIDSHGKTNVDDAKILATKADQLQPNTQK